MCKQMNCRIRFKEDDAEEDVTIVVGRIKPLSNDDDIFYYCRDMGEFNSLIGEDSGEDFCITEIYI